MGERRVTADGRILERMPDGSIVEVGRQGAQQPASQGTILPELPPPPPQAPGRTPSGAATEGLKPGFMWVDPNYPNAGQVPIPVRPTPESPKSTERRAQIKALLANIQELRTLAGKNLAVGSGAEFFQNTPFLNQNMRNVQARATQLRADITQQIIGQLAETNQGGVSGMANTASEAERMAASIAPLAIDQSLDQFLNGLQTAENYYLRQAALLEGRDGVDDKVMVDYLPKARFDEIKASAPDQTALNSESQVVKIPDWYKQSVARYIAENRDNFDPSQYAAFRLGLDEQAGFNGNLQYYVQDGARLKEGIAQGANITPIADAERPTNTLEQGITDFAQTPIGAAATTYFNSAAAGIPAHLSGRNEQVEAVRQNQPIAGFVGDLAGGVTGTMMLGSGLGALGARGIAANPMAQNAAFGGVSGATQSEDPLLGAALGAGGSLLGDKAFQAAGRALPATFAPKAMRAAEESVPTSGELGNMADRAYRAAAANGEQILPDQTNRFIDDAEKLLRENGYMTQQGEILGTGPVQDATRLLQSFRDQPIGPLEAQTIRGKIAEGRMAMREGAPDNQARMFSGQLTDQFDNFAEAANALPGISAARGIAQRRILGREVDRATELGTARGEINYSQGGADLGIRRAFGALDTADIRGSRMYPADVSAAIQKVSRGTPLRNAAQWLGRFSPQGGGGAFGGLGLGGLAGSAAGDVATGGMVTGALYGTGLFGRSVANKLTRRDAEMAALVARGGPAFQDILRQVEEEAAMRAGRIGAGAGGSVAVAPMRDY